LSSLKARCWARCLLFLMLLLAVLTGLEYWAFRRIGGWLVIEDPLQHARAVVVLSGGAPFRALGAADIYHQGWAPEVWITSVYDRSTTEAYQRLAVQYIPDREYSRQVLEKMGVPTQAIRILPNPIHNTDEEVLVIADALRQAGADRVIIVTSPPHTRRVKTIWRIEVREHTQAIVRYDSYEQYDAARWWQTTGEGDDVVHEVLGLLNARLGFVAKPKQ
jgi:uncharacterized SAM-binding protein YcdF (DUF218 family)